MVGGGRVGAEEKLDPAGGERQVGVAPIWVRCRRTSRSFSSYSRFPDLR